MLVLLLWLWVLLCIVDVVVFDVYATDDVILGYVAGVDVVVCVDVAVDNVVVVFIDVVGVVVSVSCC